MPEVRTEGFKRSLGSGTVVVADTAVRNQYIHMIGTMCVSNRLNDKFSMERDGCIDQDGHYLASVSHRKRRQDFSGVGCKVSNACEYDGTGPKSKSCCESKAQSTIRAGNYIHGLAWLATRIVHWPLCVIIDLPNGRADIRCRRDRISCKSHFVFVLNQDVMAAHQV